MDKILASWAHVTRRSLSRYERDVLANPPVCNSQMVHELLKDRLGREMVEVMCAICLDGQLRVMALTEVARGSAHSCALEMSDLFRVAIAYGASSLILAHNHPSGNPEPSPSDVKVTGAAMAAGVTLQIPIADHVIIGGERHFSFCDHGLLR
jgi:DNA repair protein RadC